MTAARFHAAASNPGTTLGWALRLYKRDRQKALIPRIIAGPLQAYIRPFVAITALHSTPRNLSLARAFNRSFSPSRPKMAGPVPRQSPNFSVR